MHLAGANGIKVAKKLWELDNQGCYVDIVANEIKHQKGRGEKKGPLEYLLKKPTGGYHGPEVREFSGKQCGVHQKDVMIDGNYNGDPNQKIVFTGSHNLNNKSVRYNDETILRIKDREIHDQFMKHFFELRAAAAITWQTSKYKTYLDHHKFNCD